MLTLPKCLVLQIQRYVFIAMTNGLCAELQLTMANDDPN